MEQDTKELAEAYQQRLRQLIVAVAAGKQPWRNLRTTVGGVPQDSGGSPIRGANALLLWASRPDQRVLAWEKAEPSEAVALISVLRRGRPQFLHIKPIPMLAARARPFYPPENMLQYSADRALRAAIKILGLGQSPAEAQWLRELAWVFTMAHFKKPLTRFYGLSPRIEPEELERLAGAAHIIADHIAIRLTMRSQRGTLGGWLVPLVDDVFRTAVEQGRAELLAPELTREEGDENADPLPLWRKCRVFKGALLGFAARHDASSPQLGWLAIGRWLATRCRAMDRDPWSGNALLSRLQTESLERAWRALLSKHWSSTWPHRWRTSQQSDVSDRRFNGVALGRMLRAMDSTTVGAIDNGDAPLRCIPLHYAGGLLSGGRFATGENSVLELIEDALEISYREGDAELRWSQVIDVIGPKRYSRFQIRKPSGGLRAIDVPCPALARVQKILSRVLVRSAPPVGVATAFLPGRTPALHALCHASCQFAVVIDIKDFFGSVRPEHVWPYLLGPDETSPTSWRPETPLQDWSLPGKSAVVNLLFAARPDGVFYLPQGAPTSPVAAHLAALRMDAQIISGGNRMFGAGNFVYTRYADDLVLSTVDANNPDFLSRADRLLRTAISRQGWRVSHAKTRHWTYTHGRLVLCGLVVPSTDTESPSLPRNLRLKARAARYRLRSAGPSGLQSEDYLQARGLASHLYAATGDPAWLAWTSRAVGRLAFRLAGPVFASSLLAGWDQALDDPDHAR